MARPQAPVAFSARPTFQHTRLNPEEHYVIRLITVEPPPPEDTDNSSPIRCIVDHVQVCGCHLAPDATLTSRFPTVNFHHYVRNRPEEDVETPHSLNLEKEKLVPKTKTPPKPDPSPGVSRNLFIEGIAQMIAHPEDTGGGFSMAWEIDSDDSDYYSDDDIRRKRGSRSVAKLGRKLRRGLRNLRAAAAPTPTTPRPPVRDRPQFQQKFTWGNYVALSYEWGPPDDGTEILLRNRNPPVLHKENTEFGVLRIRKNLENALRQLRTMKHFAKGLPLWIDALSINQQDPDELALQLPIMSAIYERAGNVVVWLGPGNQRLREEGVDLVQEFGKWYRTEYQEAYDDDESQPLRAHAHRQSVEVLFRQVMEMWKINARRMGAAFWADEGQQARLLYDFFNLNYWRRLWMIQELAMGTTDMAVIIGDRVTEWRYVRDTAFALEAIGDVFAESLEGIELPQASVSHVARIAQLGISGHRRQLPPVNGMQFMTQLNSGPTSGPLRGLSLWQVFRLLHYVRCFEPKDRVYGILALPRLPNLGIVPDPKTQSTTMVFTGFALGCIHASSRHPLEYLCLVDGATTEIDGERLPSWVADLSSERQTGIIEGRYRAGDKYHPSQAMGFEAFDCTPDLDFTETGNLQATGFVIDFVDGLGPISRLDPDIRDLGMKPDLFQPSKSPKWPVEEMTPGAAIASCFVAGADENGTRLRVRGEERLIHSFGMHSASDSSNVEFVTANANLRIDGKPLADYIDNWKGGSWYPEPGHQWNQMSPDIKALRQTMLSRVKRKRLMVTEKGYIGLVPNSVVVGDVVIIIKGHGRPLVVSEVKVAGFRIGFRLKGEAYVEGMMSGEMMEDEQRGALAKLTFI